MNMKKIWDSCGAPLTAFLALMFVSPIASASDFRGFITLFLGFPSILFSNLVLGMLLFGFYSRAWRSGLLLLLLPLYGVALLLALCVASMSGMFVLQGVGPSGEWQSLVIFFAMLTSFITSLTTVLLLFRAHPGMHEPSKPRKRAAWGALVLAVATSFPVAFDVRTLMQKDGPDLSLAMCYFILLGTAVVLHGLVIRLPSGDRQVTCKGSEVDHL